MASLVNIIEVNFFLCFAVAYLDLKISSFFQTKKTFCFQLNKIFKKNHIELI